MSPDRPPRTPGAGGRTGAPADVAPVADPDPVPPGSGIDADRLARLLTGSRERTLALCDLPGEVLCAQVSPIMSPMVWDLAHVANYEELWLVRALDGRPPTDPVLDDLYNAFEHPRWERPLLPLLGPGEARAYGARVREAALEVLDGTPRGATDPLRRDGFVWAMVVRHEHQHDETLLATRQLMGPDAPPVPGATPTPVPLPPARGGAAIPAEVTVPGGPCVLGTSTDPWAYDNERPAVVVEVPEFRIDTTPVTCARWLEFIADGGYRTPALWSSEGWRWRCAGDVTAPLFWRPEGDGAFSVLRFGRRIDVVADEPVQHISFWEAEAFAQWAGRRLPTEAEWEKAAGWDPVAGRARRWPWGDRWVDGAANVGQRLDGPEPVGSRPAGASPCGALGMVGDVWEWTSSPFTGRPGFVAHPYREYSEVFFGARYRVLRGGSWATHPVAVSTTFRNWDLPQRRQIFTGVRCARDA